MAALKKHIILLLILSLLLSVALASCKNKDEEDPDPVDEPPAEDVEPEPEEPEPEPEPEGYVYTYYEWPEEELVPYNGIVEHLFFHQVIAYPEQAFHSDNIKGFDDWMVTISELNKILDSLYERGYILVNMNDVWSEYTNADGQQRMQKNTLMLPAGRKPLVISIDDTNYYESYIGRGFMEKLIIGDDGEIWAYGHDPQGNEVISQDLDIITIFDKFIKEHPDFTMNGAKACLSLTGYEGIFGYRTNTDSHGLTPEQEAHRLEEIEAVKPIVEQLKATGWYFGCHTWGHIRLDSSRFDAAAVGRDLDRWFSDVGDIVGPTTLFFYPHGARPDGDDWHKTGEVFKYIQSRGFRVFASVGVESFSYIKTDISAVICDRLHPDGTTLRWNWDKYDQFYDSAEVFDYENRPDYGYDFGNS